jgi:NADPH-dependent ferric siderophore reductase
VTEASPPARATALDDPFAELSGPLSDTTRWQLTVVSSVPVTPGMRRVVLTSPGLADLRYEPGQDVMLLVDVDGNRPVRRRYTIRSLERETARLTLDVVIHGEGPGERWVRSAVPGTTVEGIGPRGKIFLARDADWHLFAGDAAGLPAMFAMTEDLPAGVPAHLLLEVAGPAEELPLVAPADVTLSWLHRGPRQAGEPDALAGELSRWPLPPGRGQAYLLGEGRVVRRLRDVLAERGMPAERVSHKAYWGRGKGNASHGEPAKDTNA